MSAAVAAPILPRDVIARTLATYRDELRPLLSISAAVFVPLGVLGFALSGQGAGALALSTLLNLTGMFLVQGAIVWVVERMRADAGHAPALGDTLRASREWFRRLAVASLLAAVSVMAGLLLLIVPGLVLLTWWVVLPAVIVIEGSTVRGGFARSRALVSGRAFPVFQIAVITMLIQLAFSLALRFGMLPLGTLATDLVGPTLGNTLAAPLIAVAWTLTYFDLRDLRGPPPAASPADP
ncbi:MAG: hypothetical protein RIB67_08865 [Miltoncostaeaceae bacterium]